jgi:ATP-dependent protease Clp ATPase subunit
MVGTDESADVAKCSFCGNAKHDVAMLISGPGVHICNECVGLCIDIMTEQGVPVGGSFVDSPVAQVGEQLINGDAREVRQELVALLDRMSALVRWLDHRGG